MCIQALCFEALCDSCLQSLMLLYSIITYEGFHMLHNSTIPLCQLWCICKTKVVMDNDDFGRFVSHGKHFEFLLSTMNCNLLFNPSKKCPSIYLVCVKGNLQTLWRMNARLNGLDIYHVSVWGGLWHVQCNLSKGYAFVIHLQELVYSNLFLCLLFFFNFL